MVITDIVVNEEGREWQVRGGELPDEEKKALFAAIVPPIKRGDPYSFDPYSRNDAPTHWSFTHNGDKYRCCAAETVNGKFYFLRRIGLAVPELSRIGLPEELVRALTNRDRRGLVVIGGGMGGGKTTTGSSLCREMASGGWNCVTLEDPPEYELQGRYGPGYVYQMRVTPETLAEGVATVKRQGAPEMIYIGETRDARTARQAIIEANIGHYVLTTLHASSVEDIIWRCISLSGGLEDTSLYLALADSLSLIVHQQLTRRGNLTELTTTWIDFRNNPNEDMLRGAVRERRPAFLRDHVRRKVCVSHLGE